MPSPFGVNAFGAKKKWPPTNTSVLVVSVQPSPLVAISETVYQPASWNV